MKAKLGKKKKRTKSLSDHLVDAMLHQAKKESPLADFLETAPATKRPPKKKRGFKYIGKTTGRMSQTGAPNMQQLPNTRHTLKGLRTKRAATANERIILNFTGILVHTHKGMEVVYDSNEHGVPRIIPPTMKDGPVRIASEVLTLNFLVGEPIMMTQHDVIKAEENGAVREYRGDHALRFILDAHFAALASRFEPEPKQGPDDSEKKRRKYQSFINDLEKELSDD